MIADIAIVGGGFTGAFAAAALADGTRRIVVLDAAVAPRAHFGGELIHAAGVDMLASLGLWHVLACAAGERIDGFSVRAGATDAPVLLPYGDVPAGRPGGLAMEHQEIVARVRAHLTGCSGVDVRTGERVVDVLRHNGRVAGVRTARGREIRALRLSDRADTLLRVAGPPPVLAQLTRSGLAYVRGRAVSWAPQASARLQRLSNSTASQTEPQ